MLFHDTAHGWVVLVILLVNFGAVVLSGTAQSMLKSQTVFGFYVRTLRAISVLKVFFVAGIFVHTAIYIMAHRSLCGSRDPRETSRRISDPCNDVKHRFMHIHLHRIFWLEEQVFIDVNKLMMVSVTKAIGMEQQNMLTSKTKDGIGRCCLILMLTFIV